MMVARIGSQRLVYTMPCIQWNLRIIRGKLFGMNSLFNVGRLATLWCPLFEVAMYGDALMHTELLVRLNTLTSMALRCLSVSSRLC